jgi:hypothetical protein
MASPYIEADHVPALSTQPEIFANAATDKLDRKINQLTQVPISASDQFTLAQCQENWVLELTDNGVGAPFTFDMPATLTHIIQCIVNNSSEQATIRNSAGGGTGQPVIEDAEAVIFHYDGTDFIDITELIVAASSWTGLLGTPNSFTGGSGKYTEVNVGETALAFLPTAVKQPVVAATTANITLATDIEDADVLDGVTLATGDRVLVKNQTAGEDNGIYIVTVSTPTRAADFDTADDMINAIIVVAEGTANEDTVWLHTTDGAITVDTTPLTFISFASVATFLGLSDTPGAYTGGFGLDLRVNSVEGALELASRPWKNPVIAATTANINLTTDVEDTDALDGVTLSTGDRILVKDQSTAADNGIYIVASSGAPARAEDCDEAIDFIRGFVVVVDQGTANANSLFSLDSTVATVGSDDVDFAATGGGASNRWVEATLQTTDDTTTNIALIPLASGEAKVVRGFGIGTRASSADTIAFNFIAAGKNNGGTSAEIAADIFDLLDNTTAKYVFSIDVDDTGDDIRLRVNGAAGETVDWRIQYEVITEDNT